MRDAGWKGVHGQPEAMVEWIKGAWWYEDLTVCPGFASVSKHDIPQIDCPHEECTWLLIGWLWPRPRVRKFRRKTQRSALYTCVQGWRADRALEHSHGLSIRLAIAFFRIIKLFWLTDVELHD